MWKYEFVLVLSVSLLKFYFYFTKCDSNEWKIFTGNELGALFGWWLLQDYLKKEGSAKLDNCYMIASTVSSKILQTMAKAEGFNFVVTIFNS